MTPFRRRRPWSERGTPGGSASLRSPHIRNCRAEATALGCTRTTRETCGIRVFKHVPCVDPSARAPRYRQSRAGTPHGLSDIDLWELHEAYAVTTLYNQAQLETPWEITNVNGGAVPLGHPYGMSGIRYVGSTLLELARRRRHRAIVGVCTAGGMSTAAYLERP